MNEKFGFETRAHRFDLSSKIIADVLKDKSELMRVPIDMSWLDISSAAAESTKRFQSLMGNLGDSSTLYAALGVPAMQAVDEFLDRLNAMQPPASYENSTLNVEDEIVPQVVEVVDSALKVSQDKESSARQLLSLKDAIELILMVLSLIAQFTLGQGDTTIYQDNSININSVVQEVILKLEDRGHDFTDVLEMQTQNADSVDKSTSKLIE